MHPTFTHWSWSQLLCWRECPYRAYLRYILHSPEPPAGPDDPRTRGIAIHKGVEDFIGGSDELHPELTPFQELLTQARELHGEAEVRHYLDANWRPCEREGFWAIYIPDLRVHTGKTVLTVDIKTGKKYGNEVKHFGQLQFYSIGAMCEHPDAEEFIGELWYVDQKDVVTHRFTRESLELARARLDDEVRRMLTDTVHIPRPSRVTCKYCPFGPRGTGACPVGV